MMERFLNKVFNGDARRILAELPDASVHAVISDPMYGVRNQYDWGPDPAQGDPLRHWEYHRPIYEGCLRKLKPGGILAWSVSIRFLDYYTEWFGNHQVWTVTRYGRHCSSSGNIWIVQTRERKPVPLPSERVPVIRHETLGDLKKFHPCQKTVEEMLFMVESLTKPRDIVLDCFCGIGATLIASEQLGRQWIGCDLSKRYCHVAMKRLAGRG
jgi:DNA modification methylase